VLNVRVTPETSHFAEKTSELRTELRVNGQRIDFQIDTGAEVPLLNGVDLYWSTDEAKSVISTSKVDRSAKDRAIKDDKQSSNEAKAVIKH
jgi:hypothetical protein